ncbi:MAG TPA: hypothetical protein VK162_23195 [Streptosporangiaceae bacterium]|nr:hypothetical protein [Streptosporangiaceae bacterium]
MPTTVTVRLRADDGGDGAGTLLRLEHAALLPRQRTSFNAGWGDKFERDLGLVLGAERDPARSREIEGLYRHPDLEMQR